MKILLCEDDSNIATIAKLSLVQLGGHDVTHVDDGAKALVEARAQAYDVILLDEMMPHMNGITVCENLIQECAHPIRVIFMSANPQDKNVERLAPAAIGSIPKPFDPITLSQQIQNLLVQPQRKAV